MPRVLLAAAAALAAISLARAEDHRHPPEQVAIHEQFYSSWMRPDMPNVSCCNKQDCAPVRHVRQVGGRWRAQRESDGAWLDVPPEKVEQNRDSPDGRSHLCSIGMTVICFVAEIGG